MFPLLFVNNHLHILSFCLDSFQVGVMFDLAFYLHSDQYLTFCGKSIRKEENFKPSQQWMFSFKSEWGFLGSSLPRWPRKEATTVMTKRATAMCSLFTVPTLLKCVSKDKAIRKFSIQNTVGASATAIMAISKASVLIPKHFLSCMWNSIIVWAVPLTAKWSEILSLKPGRTEHPYPNLDLWVLSHDLHQRTENLFSGEKINVFFFFKGEWVCSKFSIYTYFL